MACAVAQKYVKDIVTKRNWTEPIIDLGTGGTAYYYQPSFGDKKYVTLDLQRSVNYRVDIEGDICNMPHVQSNYYGVVLLLETLEHINNPFKAFEECYRILKPNGLFICTTVSRWAIHHHPHDFFRFLPDGLRHLCNHAGFKPFDIQLAPPITDGHQHCMCAATK